MSLGFRKKASQNARNKVNYSDAVSSPSQTSFDKKQCSSTTVDFMDRNNCLHVYPEIKVIKPQSTNSYGSMDRTISSECFATPQNRLDGTAEFFSSSSVEFYEAKQFTEQKRVCTPVKDFATSLEIANNVLEDSDKPCNAIDGSEQYKHTSTPAIEGYSKPSRELQSDSDDGESDSFEETFAKRVKKSISKFSRRQWIALAGISYVNFASVASLSILSTFFTKEALLHGANDLESGLIFGCYAVVNAIFCPIFGCIVPKIGGKPMLLSGMLISSLCSFLFSQLYRITSTTLYVGGCLLARGIQAIGCAAYFTGAMVIIVQEWRDNITFAVGLSEVFTGLGMIIGPLLGGWLYQVGGFQLPFIVVGFLMFLGLFINYSAIPSVTGRKKPGNFVALVRIPNVAATAIFMMAMWAAMDFNMPLLSLHMDELEASPVMVGAMFLIMAAAYTVCAPMIGLFAKTKFAERLIMVIGSLLVVSSFLLVGPSPIFSALSLCNVSLTAIIISMLLLGVGLAGALVPTFSDLTNSAVAGGMKDDLSTAGLVGGIFNGATFLGEFVGPFIGGSLMDYYQDFKIVSSIFAAILFAVIVGVAIFYACDWRMDRRNVKYKKHHGASPNTVQQLFSSYDEESTPLLT